MLLFPHKCAKSSNHPYCASHVEHWRLTVGSAEADRQARGQLTWWHWPIQVPCPLCFQEASATARKSPSHRQKCPEDAFHSDTHVSLWIFSTAFHEVSVYPKKELPFFILFTAGLCSFTAMLALLTHQFPELMGVFAKAVSICQEGAWGQGQGKPRKAVWEKERSVV